MLLITLIQTLRLNKSIALRLSMARTFLFWVLHNRNVHLYPSYFQIENIHYHIMRKIQVKSSTKKMENVFTILNIYVKAAYDKT